MAGQIFEIKKQHYPFQEAVKKAIEQNVLRDHRLGLISATTIDELTEEQKGVYTADAMAMLEIHGENHIPHYPDTEHICVQQTEVENG